MVDVGGTNSSLKSALCRHKKTQVVCERRADAAVACADGYSLFNGQFASEFHCFSVIILVKIMTCTGVCYQKLDELVSWNNASYNCESDGGTLALLDSDYRKVANQLYSGTCSMLTT